MSRFSARRYIIAETAVSIAVNIGLNVVPTALLANVQKAVTILGTPVLASGTVLPLFMGAFMSALVPSLLTLRRQLAGNLRTPLDYSRPTVIKVGFVSLLMAMSFAGLSMLLAASVLPVMAGASVTPVAMLLFKGAYGGLLAVLVTPTALLLLFGGSWRGNQGEDKCAGEHRAARTQAF